jgi:hypothetical protein
MTAAEHTIALFKSPQVTVAARSDHIDFAAVFHHARKPGLLKEALLLDHPEGSCELTPTDC